MRKKGDAACPNEAIFFFKVSKLGQCVPSDLPGTKGEGPHSQEKDKPEVEKKPRSRRGGAGRRKKG